MSHSEEDDVSRSVTEEMKKVPCFLHNEEYTTDGTSRQHSLRSTEHISTAEKIEKDGKT